MNLKDVAVKTNVPKTMVDALSSAWTHLWDTIVTATKDTN